jgi:hypothetical protein
MQESDRTPHDGVRVCVLRCVFATDVFKPLFLHRGKERPRQNGVPVLS